MRRPKWVLFDYGETLVHEEDCGLEAGYEAVLRLAAENPRGATPADALAVSAGFYQEILHCAREHGVEVYRPHLERLIFETLGVRFDVPYEALDDVFWDAAHPGVPSPGMPEFLAFLKVEGIPTGVVSNLGFSGASLRRRLNRLFPENEFRFVIATSDYGIRKPSPAIFNLALAKTGAAPEDVWYIGDNARADVFGAASVGMVPVWYRSDLKCSYRDERANATPEVEHIRVTDVEELKEEIRMVSPGALPPDPRSRD
jgi:putative hydrolase of the HAD superfamily